LTNESFSSLALRPDGGLLAIGDRNGKVTLLETMGLSVVGEIKPTSHEAEGFVTAMSFSPDGRTLAVGSPQGQILLWSVEQPSSPRLRFRLPGQRGPVTYLVFDPRGQRLASCCAWSEPLVEIWNLNLLRRELTQLGLAD
jgi:WD40 repeat protein